MAGKKTMTVEDVADMSVPERIRLVEDIWDSIAADAKAVPVTAAEKALIDRRLRALRRNPGACIPWEAVKASIRRRR
jgi:putative addiction module component (TIGR02574 family)